MAGNKNRVGGVAGRGKVYNLCYGQSLWSLVPGAIKPSYATGYKHWTFRYLTLHSMADGWDHLRRPYCICLLGLVLRTFLMQYILLSEPGGTRWRTGGEVKVKLANGVGSQYSYTTSGRSVSSITSADAHTSAASSRLNWLPRRFKWTRPFRRKTKTGFCACAIRFRTTFTPFFLLFSVQILFTSSVIY